MEAAQTAQLANIADLLSAKLPERDVETEVGMFRIRSLNREQATDVADTDGSAAMERKILHYGLVSPVMSMADAKRWQEASPADGGAYNVVLKAITSLSGTGRKAENEAVQRFPEDA